MRYPSLERRHSEKALFQKHQEKRSGHSAVREGPDPSRAPDLRTVEVIHSRLGNEFMAESLHGNGQELGAVVGELSHLGLAGVDVSDMMPGTGSLSLMRELVSCSRETPGEREDSVLPILDRLSRRSGQPLPVAIRRRMEESFGKDFRHVRIHTDGDSGQDAETLQARAMTLGKDIFFGKGQWRPDTDTGIELLAHELTHVVQYEQGSIAPAEPGREVSQPTDPSEHQAREISKEISNTYSRLETSVEHSLVQDTRQSLLRFESVGFAAETGMIHREEEPTIEEKKPRTQVPDKSAPAPTAQTPGEKGKGASKGESSALETLEAQAASAGSALTASSQEAKKELEDKAKEEKDKSKKKGGETSVAGGPSVEGKNDGKEKKKGAAEGETRGEASEDAGGLKASPSKPVPAPSPEAAKKAETRSPEGAAKEAEGEGPVEKAKKEAEAEGADEAAGGGEKGDKGEKKEVVPEAAPEKKVEAKTEAGGAEVADSPEVAKAREILKSVGDLLTEAEASRKGVDSVDEGAFSTAASKALELAKKIDEALNKKGDDKAGKDKSGEKKEGESKNAAPAKDGKAEGDDKAKKATENAKKILDQARQALDKAKTPIAMCFWVQTYQGRPLTGSMFQPKGGEPIAVIEGRKEGIAALLKTAAGLKDMCSGATELKDKKKVAEFVQKLQEGPFSGKKGREWLYLYNALIDAKPSNEVLAAVSKAGRRNANAEAEAEEKGIPEERMAAIKTAASQIAKLAEDDEAGAGDRIDAHLAAFGDPKEKEHLLHVMVQNGTYDKVFSKYKVGSNRKNAGRFANKDYNPKEDSTAGAKQILGYMVGTTTSFAFGVTTSIPFLGDYLDKEFGKGLTDSNKEMMRDVFGLDDKAANDSVEKGKLAGQIGGNLGMVLASGGIGALLKLAGIAKSIAELAYEHRLFKEKAKLSTFEKGLGLVGLAANLIGLGGTIARATKEAKGLLEIVKKGLGIKVLENTNKVTERISKVSGTGMKVASSAEVVNVYATDKDFSGNVYKTDEEKREKAISNFSSVLSPGGKNNPKKDNKPVTGVQKPNTPSTTTPSTNPQSGGGNAGGQSVKPPVPGNTQNPGTTPITGSNQSPPTSVKPQTPVQNPLSKDTIQRPVVKSTPTDTRSKGTEPLSKDTIQRPVVKSTPTDTRNKGTAPKNEGGKPQDGNREVVDHSKNNVVYKGYDSKSNPHKPTQEQKQITDRVGKLEKPEEIKTYLREKGYSPDEIKQFSRGIKNSNGEISQIQVNAKRPCSDPNAVDKPGSVHAKTGVNSDKGEVISNRKADGKPIDTVVVTKAWLNSKDEKTAVLSKELKGLMQKEGSPKRYVEGGHDDGTRVKLKAIKNDEGKTLYEVQVRGKDGRYHAVKSDADMKNILGGDGKQIKKQGDYQRATDKLKEDVPQLQHLDQNSIGKHQRMHPNENGNTKPGVPDQKAKEILEYTTGKEVVIIKENSFSIGITNKDQSVTQISKDFDKKLLKESANKKKDSVDLDEASQKKSVHQPNGSSSKSEVVDPNKGPGGLREKVGKIARDVLDNHTLLRVPFRPPEVPGAEKHYDKQTQDPVRGGTITKDEPLK